MVKRARHHVTHSAYEHIPGEKRDLGRRFQDMRLASFLQAHTEQIVAEWEAFAKTLAPANSDMTSLALRNHILEILDFIVADMTSYQSSLEQVRKSQGLKQRHSGQSSVAETHAALRLASGFNIDQMVTEYRALRACVIKLWMEAINGMDRVDVQDLTRFNESVDQALAESISHYTKTVNQSKDLFAGILSHDLRTPLNVISMSAELLLKPGRCDEQQITLSSQIYESACRMSQLVSDLLDVTRARFGSGLPVVRAPMDMGEVAQQLVAELQASNPTRTISLKVSGNVNGEWDKARIGQVLSNLIGNAIQYGRQDSPIDVAVKGVAEEVVLSVHNEGVPIPPDKIDTIFDALTRAITAEGDHPERVNLGLGLYITKEIVVSHGGTIAVTSSAEKGTTFTARFPRAVPV